MTLEQMLIKHEGIKLKPYKCKQGKITIGVGRNLGDLGITEQEAVMLMRNDINRITEELSTCFSWFAHLSINRRDALVDMCFNLGLTKFLGFAKMIHAIRMCSYDLAADEMLDSLWASQVGGRAEDLAGMMRLG